MMKSAKPKRQITIGDDTTSISEVAAIGLSLIDPTSIDVGSNKEGSEWYVALKTKAGSKVISVTRNSSHSFLGESPKEEETRDSDSFVFPGDEESARRAAKALTQVVRACQKDQ